MRYLASGLEIPAWNVVADQGSVGWPDMAFAMGSSGVKGTLTWIRLRRRLYLPGLVKHWLGAPAAQALLDRESVTSPERKRCVGTMVKLLAI